MAHKRRAFAPDQYEAMKGTQVGTGLREDDGKSELPRVTQVRPMRGQLVERSKVVGILEEGSDGNLYLSQFEKAQAEEQDEQEEEVVTEKASWICPIIKATEENDQRLVTGIVLEPETVDAQEDIYDSNVIRKAAHDFLREYNAGNVVGFMHKEMNRSLDLVESWIAPSKMKIGNRDIKKGTWLMTVHVIDENIWKSVKEDKITGFSIGGIAKVQSLVDDNEE
jgi:hypothetical protein